MAGVLIAVVVIAVMVAFTVLAYRRRWGWTGLPADSGDGSPARPPRPAKTLWDWLQLLVVPLVLALAAFALNAAQADRDQHREDRRAADQRVIAEDRAQEDTLRTYFQQMSDLITQSKVEGQKPGMVGDTKTLARTLTLVALRRLDGRRKGLVVQFLVEAGLITHTVPIVLRSKNRSLVLRGTRPKVSLALADLRDALMPSELGPKDYRFGSRPGAPLGYGQLRAASFDGADLQGADFRRATLTGVSFENANLREATFDGAYFGAASFAGSCLTGASFVGAQTIGPLHPDFTEAAGSGVDFSSASLDYADVTNSLLSKVKLDGASTKGVRVPRSWSSSLAPESDAQARNLCRAQR